MQKQVNISPEEKQIREADFKKRHLEFDKGIKDLCVKYEVELTAEPFVYRGLLVAKPTVSDSKKYKEDEVIEQTPDSVPTAMVDEVAEAKVDEPTAEDGGEVK